MEMKEDSLFAEVLALRPEERAAFLDEACGGDEALRGRVWGLLEAAEAAGPGFLESPGWDEGPTVVVEPGSGGEPGEVAVVSVGPVRYFGDYELRGEIARGAMGVVYRAEQTNLRREVALKMIRPSLLAGEREVARFRAEAEAAASLSHPNIVPIYEIGEHEGQHYYTMELVEGGTLARRMGRLRERPREAVELLRKVALAIHAAHQRGILHRDLKPGNILVDEAGEPHVTDFGLAKQMEEDGGLTLSGQIMGTPNYMAPEQVAGGAGLTTAADVHALGAILYEVLTGEPPYRGESVLEVLRQVVEDEPRAPRSMSGKVDRDLSTIALKCLRKDPRERYASAQGLANDLGCWLRGEPIGAREVGSWEKGVKWVRRKPYHAAAAGLALLLLLTFGIGGPVAAVRQAELREEAEAARGLAEASRVEAEGARELAEERYDDARRNLYAAQMASMAQYHDNPHMVRRLERLTEAWVPVEGEKDLRGWEWYFFNSYGQQDAVQVRNHGHDVNTIMGLTWTPCGARVGAYSRGLLRVLDGASGQLEGQIQLEHWIRHAQFSPCGRHIAIFAEDPEQGAWLYDAESLELVRPLEVGPAVRLMEFSPGGEQIALLCEGQLQLLDTGTGRMVKEVKLAEVIARDLPRLWEDDGSRDIERTATLRARVVRKMWEEDLMWGADGLRVAAIVGKTVQVYGEAADEMLYQIEFEEAPRVVRFSPDGRQLGVAISERPMVVEIWRLEGGPYREQSYDLRFTGEHHGSSPIILWHPDGGFVATSEGDNVFVFGLESGEEVASYTFDRSVLQLGWSPDGRRMAVGGYWGWVDLFNPFPSAPLRNLGQKQGFTWSRDGRLLLGWDDRRIDVWDSRDWSLVRTISADAPVYRASVGVGNGSVVASHHGGGLTVWPVGGGEVTRTIALEDDYDWIDCHPAEALVLAQKGNLYSVIDYGSGEVIDRAAFTDRRWYHGSAPRWLPNGEEIVSGLRAVTLDHLTFSEGKLRRIRGRGVNAMTSDGRVRLEMNRITRKATIYTPDEGGRASKNLKVLEIGIGGFLDIHDDLSRVIYSHPAGLSLLDIESGAETLYLPGSGGRVRWDASHMRIARVEAGELVVMDAVRGYALARSPALIPWLRTLMDDELRAVDFTRLADEYPGAELVLTAVENGEHSLALELAARFDRANPERQGWRDLAATMAETLEVRELGGERSEDEILELLGLLGGGDAGDSPAHGLLMRELFGLTTMGWDMRLLVDEDLHPALLKAIYLIWTGRDEQAEELLAAVVPSRPADQVLHGMIGAWRLLRRGEADEALAVVAPSWPALEAGGAPGSREARLVGHWRAMMARELEKDLGEGEWTDLLLAERALGAFRLEEGAGRLGRLDGLQDEDGRRAAARLRGSAEVQGRLVPLVTEQTPWRYLVPTDGEDPFETGEPQVPPFSEIGFDDSGWAEAATAGGIGYNDEVATEVEAPPVGQRYSGYFRCEFEHQGGEAALVLVLERDDGVVVYLNGEEVARDNVADGEAGFRTPARRVIYGLEEIEPVVLPISARLRPGRNVLAISVHQENEENSDLFLRDVRLFEVGAWGQGGGGGGGVEEACGRGGELLRVGLREEAEGVLWGVLEEAPQHLGAFAALEGMVGDGAVGEGDGRERLFEVGWGVIAGCAGRLGTYLEGFLAAGDLERSDRCLRVLYEMGDEGGWGGAPWLAGEWWLAGPFALDGGDEPEAAAAVPALPLVGGGEGGVDGWERLSWREGGALRLAEREFTVHHFYTRVWSPVAQRLGIDLGDDDWVEVFHDGELVLRTRSTGGGAKPGQHQLAVELTPGWNPLMVRLVNRKGGAGLVVELSDDEEVLARGRAVRALELAARAVEAGDGERALELLAAAGAEGGDPVEMARRRAFLYEDAMAYEHAVAEWGRAIELAPEEIDYLMERGKVLHDRLGEFGRALEDFERVLEAAPETGWAWLYRARCLIALGRLDEAEPALERALETIPPNSREAVWRSRARGLWSARGEWELAMEDIRRLEALGRHGDSGSRWYQRERGVMALMAGDREQVRGAGEELYGELAEDEGDWTWLWWPAQLLLRADEELGEEDRVRIEGLVERLEEELERGDRAAVLRAQLLLRTGRAEEAAEVLERGTPGWVEARYVAAMVAAKLGRGEEAEELLAEGDQLMEELREEGEEERGGSRNWPSWQLQQVFEREARGVVSR
jgi:eukaryotic-like serine/threonine-protein kinase